MVRAGRDIEGQAGREERVAIEMSCPSFGQKPRQTYAPLQGGWVPPP